MSKFIVESKAWYGTQWTKEFDSFEKAKKFFRKKIVCPDAAPQILEHIKKYAEEQYPEDTPAAFEQLIHILNSLLTNPSYPQNLDDVVLEDFEDDNIEFYMDLYSKEIFCYVDNEEYDGKFPLAEINVLKMDDEEEEYFFYLTEKRDGMCLSWNLSLSRQ